MRSQLDDFTRIQKYLPTGILILHLLAPIIPIYALLALNIAHILSIIFCKQYKQYYIWVSFVIFIIGFVTTFFDAFTGNIIMAMSLFKLFALLNFSGLQTILNASMPLLIGVLLLLLFFYLIFAVMGLSMFQNSLNRFCFVTVNTSSFPSKDDFPASVRTNQHCGINQKGYQCPPDQKCLFSPRNDGFTFLTYNDIFHSFLTVFVATSLEDWTAVMYWTMAGEYYIAFIFYIVLVIFVSFILLKLFVAVITETYDNIRAKERQNVVVTDTFLFKNNQFSRLYLGETFTNCMASIISIELVIRIVYSEINSDVPQWFYPVSLELAFCFIYISEGLMLLASVHLRLLSSSNSSILLLFLCAGNLIGVFSVALNNSVSRYFLVFSLLRTPRIVHLMPRIRKLGRVIIKSYKQLLSLFLLSISYIILGSVILNLIFMDASFDPTDPNYIFDFGSFWGSFAAVFQVFIGDGWDNVTLNSMYFVSSVLSSNVITVLLMALFFIIYYFIAHFVISNLLVGVILENFGLTESEKRLRQLKAFFKDFKRKNDQDGEKLKRINPYSYHKQTKNSYLSHFLPSNYAVPGIRKELIAKFIKSNNTDIIDDYLEERHSENEFNDDDQIIEASLFCFKRTNIIRQTCLVICKSNYFEYFIRLVIVASIIEAAFDTPSNRLMYYQYTWNIYRIMDLVFIVLFSMEFLLKTLAFGFVFNKKSYLRNPWNRFDFIVLLLQIIGFLADAQDSTGVARVLRVSKAIRVLRIINQFKGIRDIFSFIILAFSRIIDASLLSLIVFVPFALYGNYIYMNLFESCNDSTVKSKLECMGYFNIESQLGITILVPRVWKNHYSPYFTYDSFATSLLTTFVLSTSESWTDIFNMANMAIAYGYQPQPTATIHWFPMLYFFSFMIIGCLIVVNMFAGIIIQNFLNISGLAYLTIEQRQYIDLMKQIKLVKPTVVPNRPINTFQARCYDILMSPYYIKVINSCLLATVLINMVQYYDEPVAVKTTRDVLLSLFIVIFFIDVIIRYNGFGYRKWKKSFWNLFDFVVVVGALITTAFQFIFQLTGTSTVEVVIFKRVFVLTISFKLVQRVPVLTQLFKTIIASFGQIMNMLAVFGLLLLTFALIFMEIFGLTRYYHLYNSDANFRTLPNAMLLLMRMITGESWHRIMDDCLIDNSSCVQQDENYLMSDCGSKIWGFVLFLSYYIICTYVFVNMFIVIVLENFSYFYNENVKFSVVSREDIVLFKSAWAQYDLRGKGYINNDQLIPFLKGLRGRLQVKLYPDNLHVLNITSDMRDMMPSKLRDWDNIGHGEMVRILERYRFHFDSTSKQELQQRRIKFNRVYMECMMNLNERGIPFNTVLLVLMNNVVNDQTFLRIDEFIKRKQVIEEVDEKIYLEKANGILTTIIQKRKFIKLKTPNQDIPQIIIEDDYGSEQHSRSSNPPTPSPSASDWSDSDMENTEENLVDKIKQNSYYGIFTELRKRRSNQ
eukprot:NODE_187_length_15673_cov_0.222743.p1 type:complete len:1475 gc:universal NODE_187_length_15673_cov_0.222743:15514-11090(-)